MAEFTPIMRDQSRLIRDHVTLKRYGSTYRLTHIKNYINPDSVEPEEDRLISDKGSVNDTKLSNNLARTRSRIYELAACNPWEYFVTLTFSENRHDLDNHVRKITSFIRGCNRNHGLQIKYLLIPELHADGESWHLHGFLMGLPLEELTPFTKDMHLPYAILNKLENGQTVYNWIAYAKRFGYCSIETIRSVEAASKYINKYITKDLERSVTDLNAHMFYASQGLEGAQLVAKGTLARSLEYENLVEVVGAAIDEYENEYVHVVNFRDLDVAMSFFDLETAVYAKGDEPNVYK